MGNVIWDISHYIKDIGFDINNFLYEDGRPKLSGGKEGKRRSHTEDEYREFLSCVREGCFERYKEIESEFGWRMPVKENK